MFPPQSASANADAGRQPAPQAVAPESGAGDHSSGGPQIIDPNALATIQASPQVVESPQSQAQFHILTGEMAAGRDMPAVAAQEFLKALEITPDKQLAARATGLALTGRREDLALIAAHKWLVIEPSSLDASEIITRLALRAGQDEEAFQQAVAIVHNFPGGVDDGLHHVAVLFAQEPTKGDTARALMSRLVAQYPKRAAAHAALGMLDLRFSHLDEAESEAREALKLGPGSRDSTMLLVGVLLKQNRVPDADRLIEELARSNPKDVIDLRLSYARLLLEDSQHDPQHEAARRQLQSVLKLDQDNSSAHYALGLLDLEDQKLDSAEAHLRPLTKNGDKNNDRRAEASYFLGRIAEFRGKAGDALELYGKVNIGNQALDASVRRATLLARMNHLPEAREIFEQLRRQYPPMANRFYASEGEMLLSNGSPNEGLALFNQALSLYPGDVDLLYSRSLAYERLDRINEAENDLRAILLKSPDDVRAMNALGYMLTVHNAAGLDEAQKLIAHALQMTPEDPAVIDSMGWLQYKSGRPKEALPYLQKALSLMPDPEVAAHLGEVLWVLGDHDQARSIWKAAQQAAPGNAALQETVNRLSQPGGS
jgi:tetratricopeptide (TPR) repeat protein